MLKISRFYLQRDVLSKCDVSGHSEVIELQHVRDVFKPGQKVLNLQNKNNYDQVTEELLCSLRTVPTFNYFIYDDIWSFSD